MDQTKIINRHYVRYTAGFSCALIALIAFGLLCPLVPASSYADSSDAVIAETGVNVGSMISVAINSSIDIDMQPSNNIVHDKKAARLTVTTNNSSGYSLYMQTVDGTADLRSGDLSNSAAIAPLEKASILDQFTANTWGYNLGRAGSVDKNRIYYPVPTTNTAIVETGGTAYQDDYDLTFGVAIGNDLPVGRYSNSVIITAIANPVVITSINQAEYMQSMNVDICKNTDYGITKQLIDLRDGKKYWVERLLDGNCWMQQNLALTLKDFGDGEGIKAVTENGDMGAKLTSSNTDFMGVWDETSLYPPTETLYLLNTGTSVASKTESWDLGPRVLATPMLDVSCSNSTATFGCASIGFVDVSDTDKFSPGFEATMGDWEGATVTKNTLITVNCTEWEGTGTAKICTAGTYDEHYLVGNYYKYNAATAGAGYSVAAGGIVTSSICPKGWRLPLSSAANDKVSGSFYYLLDKYGLTSKASSDLTAAAGSPTENYNIVARPFNYVKAGYVVGSANILAMGVNGLFWSSSVAYLSSAYYALLVGSTVTPSYVSSGGYANSQYAYNVRCAIY